MNNTSLLIVKNIDSRFIGESLVEGNHVREEKVMTQKSLSSTSCISVAPPFRAYLGFGSKIFAPLLFLRHF
jgi:hypothetical protein